MKTFKDLTKGQKIRFSDMSQNSDAVVKAQNNTDTIIEWYDGEVEMIPNSKEIEFVPYFKNYDCGFFAINL